MDFADEEIEFISAAELRGQLHEAAAEVARIRAQLALRARHDSLPRVVLFGWPNVGKSSLYNALLGDAAAIVSPEAGTTTDYLSRPIAVDGLEVLLVDTAGFTAPNPGTCDVAGQAWQRMAGQATEADLLLLCLDATRPLNAWEEAECDHREASRRLVVWTKIDAADRELHPAGISTSSRTERGLDELRRAIRERLEAQGGSEPTAVTSTSVRCRESLRRTAGHCAAPIACRAGREMRTW